jgi:hypothetical protein
MKEDLDQEKLSKRNLPRDVFLHLFVILALYWSAVSFIALVWQYINYFFPDPLTFRYGQANLFALRFAVSSLIIIFPLFIFSTRYLNKIYEKEKEARELKIRKWMIYLTLFIASLVIIVDLISIINNFLGGEIKIRFILKALSVLMVAGVIFGYYLDDIKRKEPSKLTKYFGWGTSFLVLIGVVGAFFIIGSPAKARLMQFDHQRVSDLQSIQWQIVNYWQKKEKLPPDLDLLNDPISGYFLPKDPQTGNSYEYRIKDEESLKFELCATFNLDSKELSKINLPFYPPPPNFSFSDNWNHSAGRFCFERQIDKKLYPPFSQKENGD